MKTNTPAPRIVIYGVGQFNKLVARMALEKGWPVVAAVNRAGPKVGQDLGRLLGLERDLGVIVQDAESADYKSMNADIAVMAINDFLKHNRPIHKKLLSSGLNVLCHGAQSYYPQIIDKEIAADLDATAKANKVTFTGGGIWDMSRIWAGMLIAGPCTKIDSMDHVSVTDIDRYGPDGIRKLGVGLPAEQHRKLLVEAGGDLGEVYKIIPAQVLHGLGYKLTGTVERREPVLFEEKVFCQTLNCDIEPGISCGTRMVAEATTEEGLTATASIELRLMRPGEVEHMRWSVQGKPSTRIVVERDDTIYFSASSLFNRIKDVIAAPPGLVTIDQLGPMKHTALG